MVRYRVWYHPRGKDVQYTMHSSRTAAENAARKSKIAEKVVYRTTGKIVEELKLL
jgi:hypothetical protein